MQPPLNFICLLGYRIPPAYGHIREDINSIIQDKQILAIFGYPIKCKIVDREDRVILNLGDLITLEAVIQARQAGQLDTLLNGVYRSN